jgi:hypothetical protein
MNLDFACRKCFSIDESNFLRFFLAMLWMRKRCRSHKKTSKFHYHSRINRIRQRLSLIRVQYICRSIFAIITKTIFFDRTMLEAISESFWIVYIHSTYDNISFHHWKHSERHLQRLIIWFWNENQQLMSSSCEISLMRTCSIHILSIIYFLQIITNHNTSFILEKKIVWVRFINEYSFQWYQFIIVSFIDDFSRLSRFNNVVFYLRSFYKFFNMRMSQHSFSMKRWFRQIVHVKFKRRCRFYFEFCRFRIENDHQCCVKYEDFFHFFVDSIRVRKIFRRFSNSFFFDDVDFINAKVYISRNQHVQKCIFDFRKFIR